MLDIMLHKVSGSPPSSVKSITHLNTSTPTTLTTWSIKLLPSITPLLTYQKTPVSPSPTFLQSPSASVSIIVPQTHTLSLSINQKSPFPQHTCSLHLKIASSFPSPSPSPSSPSNFLQSPYFGFLSPSITFSLLRSKKSFGPSLEFGYSMTQPVEIAFQNFLRGLFLLLLLLLSLLCMIAEIVNIVDN